MYFQTLDDKSECVGVYLDGQLHFHEQPTGLSRTWKFTGSVVNPDIEYAWLMCGGKSLAEVCPEELSEELQDVQQIFQAFLTSFGIAKINLMQNCFFDLVPQDFLLRFCETRNKITKHVFETHERPDNYDHLDAVYRLLHKIRYQRLNLSLDGCRELMVNTKDREDIKKIINVRSPFIDYNLFGTVTGRLTTNEGSNPILTMKSQYRKVVKPTNDWLISLDYNGAEVRTLLSLSGNEQPDEDIHNWNMFNLYSDATIDREEAKVRFFSSLYNPNDSFLDGSVYSRDSVLRKHYIDGAVHTPFGRKIEVGRWKALNYLIQSTTADLALDRAVALDRALEGYKSRVAFIVHDEVVIDLCDDEKHLVPLLRDVFQDTKLGKFLVNLKAGKDYGSLEALGL